MNEDYCNTEAPSAVSGGAQPPPASPPCPSCLFLCDVADLFVLHFQILWITAPIILICEDIGSVLSQLIKVFDSNLRL